MRHLLALLAAVPAAFVLAVPASAQTVTIKLSSVRTIQVPRDTKPLKQANKGDSIYFKDLLLNRVAQFGKKKGQPVAWDVALITYTSETGRKLTCIATFPGLGTITYGGVVANDRDGRSTFPIISGTGGFKHATGTVTIGEGTKTQPSSFVITVPGNKIDVGRAGGVA